MARKIREVTTTSIDERGNTTIKHTVKKTSTLGKILTGAVLLAGAAVVAVAIGEANRK
jgi:hypothetical protein